MVCVIIVHSFVFGFLHGPQHFCLFSPDFSFLPLGAGPCSGHSCLHTLVLRIPGKVAWQKACQSAQASIFDLLQLRLSGKVRNTPTSCVRKVSSSAPSRITAPGKSAGSFGFTTFLDIVSSENQYVYEECPSQCFTDLRPLLPPRCKIPSLFSCQNTVLVVFSVFFQIAFPITRLSCAECRTH